MKLVLPYPPSANRYWRVDRRGFAYVSPDARMYKNRIRLAAMADRLKPFDGPVMWSMRLFRPQRSGDLSNRIKVMEDALIGVAFEDDALVEEIHAFRFEDRENPRVEITVEPLPRRAS